VSSIEGKFVQHAETLKKRIEHPGGFNNGDDTAYVSFLHQGQEFTVSVTSNVRTLSASLWKEGRCLLTVMGKDGVLFTEPVKL
jgi:hypothetical protein